MNINLFNKNYSNKVSLIKYVIICILFFCVYKPFFSQTNTAVTDATISYNGSGSYWMVERSNFSRYDNGSYTGHTSREVRSFVYPIAAPSNSPTIYKYDTWFDGSFSVDEKTVSNYRSVALGLDGSIPACFHIASNGTLTTKIDNGFPTFRSFPAYPSENVKIGDSWVSSGVRVVDPLNKGLWTKLPMTVQYTYKGAEVYKGKDVYRIHAKWATRYGMRWFDSTGDPDLQSAQGSNDADILVLQDTGAAFVISDYVDETFVYADNSTVRFRGTLTMFTEFPPSTAIDKLLPKFEKIATVAENTIADSTITDMASTNSQETTQKETIKPAKPLSAGAEGVIIDNTAGELDESEIELKNNMLVENTPAGLRLSVRDIRFKPNSSEFEEGESWRLDVIAETLLQVPDGVFLIEGHTAAIGTEKEDAELSLARAQTTAKELEKRGIGAEQFICKGRGRDYPVATNDTVEGRAQNRRVEITILQ